MIISNPVFAGISICAVYTLLWITLRNRNVNHLPRIAITVVIILAMIGFWFGQLTSTNSYVFAITIILGLSPTLVGAMDLDINSIVGKRMQVIWWIIMCCLGLLTMTYFATPGYIIPFLNNPTARMILFCLIAWQLFGILIYSRAWKFSNSTLELSSYFVFAIIFAIPINLAFMLGPAMTTIVGGF